MKKLLINLLVFTLVLSTLPSLNKAESLPETDIHRIDNSIEHEPDVNIEEELKLEITKDTSEEIVVESQLTTSDFEAKVDVKLTIETEDIRVFGSVLDSEGKETNVNFDVTVFESNDDKFVALFHDRETGKDYVYDTTEITASVLPAVPIVVAFLARWGVQKAVQHFGKTTLRAIAKNMTKADSPVWKRFSTFRGKTKTSGSGKKKRYYEWDNTHNDIEVYDHNGKHLGSMDPLTGEMYKGAVKGRKIKL
ncbi:SAR2788 family putative toxin [Sutcliffiella halmapala]|uniref:SAR2788 family putative toxin n=1 Tax=Sutcliffiella halmapala TaxID=79882 RepID=UPI000994C9F6|nr:SAR2788 family putative toxin [Sutcliffiella halmapala]